MYSVRVFVQSVISKKCFWEVGKFMSKILIEIPLTKYLKLQAEFYGGLDDIFLTKLDKGKVYMSDGKPWIDPEDVTNVDFESGYTYIPKDFSKHVDLKRGESKLVKDVIKELREKEKQSNKN